jgi:hypothetical protein
VSSRSRSGWPSLPHQSQFASSASNSISLRSRHPVRGTPGLYRSPERISSRLSCRQKALKLPADARARATGARSC